MSTSPEALAGTRRLPGDLAMWLFILAELSVFAILILVFAVAQRLDAEGFRAGRAALDLSLGLALTLSLLTAGFLAAAAVELVRRGYQRRAGFLLLAALALGLLHVWLGLVILGWMALRCLRGAYAQGALGGLESGALYWHMVDLVWVMLFPLVYVLAPLP